MSETRQARRLRERQGSEGGFARKGTADSAASNRRFLAQLFVESESSRYSSLSWWASSTSVTIAFHLVAAVGSCTSCEARDIVLQYLDSCPDSSMLEVLLVPESKVIALPRPEENRATPTPLPELIAKAQRALKDSNQEFSLTLKWLPERVTAGNDPSDSPFSTPGVTTIGQLNWRFLEGVAREIDLGATRANPTSWTPVPSGRFWWELSFLGSGADGSSVGTLTVFLLQDGQLLFPQRLKALPQETNEARHILKTAGANAKDLLRKEAGVRAPPIEKPNKVDTNAGR